MLRLLVLSLSVVGLLACPYHCMGMLVSNDQQNVPTCGCGQCRPAQGKETEQSKDAPDRPLSDSCDCNDCLCSGAVRLAADPIHSLESTIWLPALGPNNAGILAISLATAQFTRLSDTHEVCGRAMRVLFRSLLI